MAQSDSQNSGKLTKMAKRDLVNKIRQVARKSPPARSTIYLLCDSIDSLGGVETFARQFQKLTHYLDKNIVIVSRFNDARAATPEASHVQYLYPKNFRELLQKKDSSKDPKSIADLEHQINSAKEVARANLNRIADGWIHEDYIFAVQAGSLLEVFDHVGEQKLSRVTKIAQYHGTYEYAILQPYWQRYLKALAKVDTTIALSKGDAERFQAAGARNVINIPNAVDLNTPGPDMSKRPFKGVYIGRLEHEKSVNELLSVWSLLKQSIDPAPRLEIYGAGSSRAELEQLTKELDIEELVEFKGRTSRPTEIFANSRLNLLTSHREGMPMSILEANSVGTPTVAYNASPGIEEIVRDEINGRLIDVGNIELFKQAVERLFSDTDRLRKLANNAYLHSENYTHETVNRQWKAIFEPMKQKTNFQDKTPRRAESALRIIDVNQRTDVTSCVTTITLVFAEIEVPEKSLIFTVSPENATNLEDFKRSVSLPWSTLVDAGYAYVPNTTKTERSTSLSFTQTGSQVPLQINIRRWGLKQLDPMDAIQRVYISHTPSNGFFREVGVMAKVERVSI